MKLTRKFYFLFLIQGKLIYETKTKNIILSYPNEKKVFLCHIYNSNYLSWGNLKPYFQFHDFRVSDVMLLGGANSGQTFAMLSHRRINIENTWPWNWKSNILIFHIYFPNFMFRRKCLNFSVAWRSGNEENISKWYWDTKKSTNQEGHFLDFQGFSWRYEASKSSLHLRTEISLMEPLTPESSIKALNCFLKNE